MTISRQEQETIVKYNAAEQAATVYARDKTVMRRLDALLWYREIYIIEFERWVLGKRSH